MAQANISVTESQFRCPVCLDLLRNPVSTPCGHTYCMSCINNYWDQAEPGKFSCPQCRETFSPRPVLRRNTVLAEVVDKLKLSDVVTAPELYLGGVGEVPCDFCPAESALRAAKSCLVCLASFCELHVLPHRDVGTLRRHKLVAAVESPAERLCAQHRLGLEPAGGGAEAGAAAEWSGDCLLCEADREEVHSVDAQRARRQVRTHAAGVREHYMGSLLEERLQNLTPRSLRSCVDTVFNVRGCTDTFRLEPQEFCKFSKGKISDQYLQHLEDTRIKL